MLDFTLMIPTWAPEGFSLQQTEYPMPGPFLRYSINWHGPNGMGINMMYFPATDWPTGREIRVLRGAWEETMVQGTPAVIVHGECRFAGGLQPAQSIAALEFAWDDSFTRLNWYQDEVFYELIARDLDSDILIRMAESAR
jgi:hypothetical protein